MRLDAFSSDNIFISHPTKRPLSDSKETDKVLPSAENTTQQHSAVKHFSDNPAYVQMANQNSNTAAAKQLSLETLVINPEFPANHRTLSSILDKLLQNNSENHSNTEIKNIFQRIKDDISISIIDTNSLNAFADKGSNKLYISKGLINAVLNQHEYQTSAHHELAFILGHELSHLVYDQHIKKQNSNTAMSQSEEYFCDRLALELCDNAGFDIKYAKFDTISQENQTSIGFLSSHPHSSDRDFVLNELRQINYWKNLETLNLQRISPLQEYESERKSPLDKLLNSPASLNSGQNREEILLNTARLLLHTDRNGNEGNFQKSLKKIIQNSILEDSEKQIYLRCLSRLDSKHKSTDHEAIESNIHQLSKAALNLPKLPEYLEVLNAIHDNSIAIRCLNNCFKNIYSYIKQDLLNVKITSDKESEKLLELIQNDSLLIRFGHHDGRSITQNLTSNHVLKLISEDLSSENTIPKISYDHLSIEQQDTIKKQFQTDPKFKELILRSANLRLLSYVKEEISLNDILNLRREEILPIVCMKDLKDHELNKIQGVLSMDDLKDYIKSKRLNATEVLALIKLFKNDEDFIDELSKSTIKIGYGLMETNENEDFNIIKITQRQIYEELSLKEFYELIKETDGRSGGDERANIGKICLEKISQKYDLEALSEKDLNHSLEISLNIKTADIKIKNNSQSNFSELSKEDLFYLSKLSNSTKIKLMALNTALDKELTNFSKDTFLDFVDNFELKESFARYYRNDISIDKSQDRSKISETYPFENYTLLDAALIKILDTNKLNTNNATEIFNFISEVLKEKSLERDFFLNRYVKIEELKDFDTQINFLNSFSNEHLGFEQRMFLFNQEITKCQSLDENVILINRIFIKASKEKDELLNSAFNQYGLKFSEFKELRKLFTHDDPQYEESRSLISGSLKSLLIGEDAEERINILNWLTKLTDIKPKSIEEYEENNHVDADELRLLMSNKAIRLEILNSLCVGNSQETLFHENNQTRIDLFLDELLDTSFSKAQLDSRDKNLEILCKSALSELFKISNQNKKLNILNNLIELGIVNEDASIGELICGFLGNLGAIGVKFGQTLASNTHIETHYPDLHKELSKLKENFSPMGIQQAMIAIEQNPSLHDKDIRIIKPLAAASLKGVFLIEFEGQEAILKVFRPEINKNLDDEKQEFSLLLENLNPTIKNLFALDRIPNYSESLFTALKEEISIEKEISNNQNLSQILSSYSNLDFSLNTAKSFPLENPRFIIIEEVAPGQSYESLRKEINERDLKNSLDDLQNLCFVKSALEEGFYHADPHRGNIFIKLEDKKPTEITFIDSGLCGELPKNLLNKPYIKEIMHIIGKPHQESLWSNIKNIPSLIKAFIAIKEDFPELKSIKPTAFLDLLRKLKQNDSNAALTIANWLELNSDSDRLNRFFMTMAKLDIELIIKNIKLLQES